MSAIVDPRFVEIGALQGSHSCKQGTSVEAIYLPAHGQTDEHTQIPCISLCTQQAVNK